VNVVPDAAATSAEPNDASVPVPPDVPLHPAGVQRVTVCSAPLVFTHETVSPTATVTCSGTKQNAAQCDEIVTVTVAVVARLLAARLGAANLGAGA
jgi:hypothetical protein